MRCAIADRTSSPMVEPFSAAWSLSQASISEGTRTLIAAIAGVCRCWAKAIASKLSYDARTEFWPLQPGPARAAATRTDHRARAGRGAAVKRPPGRGPRQGLTAVGAAC